MNLVSSYDHHPLTNEMSMLINTSIHLQKHALEIAPAKVDELYPSRILNRRWAVLRTLGRDHLIGGSAEESTRDRISYGKARTVRTMPRAWHWCGCSCPASIGSSRLSRSPGSGAQKAFLAVSCRRVPAYRQTAVPRRTRPSENWPRVPKRTPTVPMLLTSRATAGLVETRRGCGGRAFVERADDPQCRGREGVLRQDGRVAVRGHGDGWRRLLGVQGRRGAGSAAFLDISAARFAGVTRQLVSPVSRSMMSMRGSKRRRLRARS